MLSYLSSGVSASSSEQSRLAGLVINLGTFSIVCMIALLAFLPSWPLAVGVAAGCIAIGYLFHAVMRAVAAPRP
ncbi:MAG: hypothetical protein DCF27_12235 [Lysobacteraceae bacterium]|nr:MAG: hypothetical protein DCF27_12235 [Xanthomonadaceae bacterium]